MINDIINKAKKRPKKIAETQYEDTCTVTERTPKRNETNKRNELIETQTLINQPCKLTHKTITSSVETPTISNVVQQILLFISPNVSIKPDLKLKLHEKKWNGGSI